MIRLHQPWSLLVLLLFPLVLRRLGTFPRGSAIRRGGAWLCLAVALAGPSLGWGRGDEATVLLVDFSASAARALGKVAPQLHALARTLVPRAIIGFAETPVVVVGPETARQPRELDAGVDRLVERPDTLVPVAEREQTNLAAALDFAARAMPTGEGGRILLVSDGWETEGDARQAMRAGLRRGIAVDVFPLDVRRAGPDAAVDDVELPTQLYRDVPVELRAVLRTSSPGPARVELLEDGVVIAERPVTLPSEQTPVTFTIKPALAGEHWYGVRALMPGDREPRNDMAARGVRVLGPPVVLWLGTEPPPNLSGLRIVAARPNGGSGLAAPLETFDAVVLANVPAPALPPDMLAGLPAYVGTFGGGILMLGAGQSFAPGGYRLTEIERVLPVDLDPGHRGRRPGLALLVALDKSGSMAEAMGAVPKIAAAREAIMAAATLLESGDRFGLLAFDSRAIEILPLGPVPGRPGLQLILDGVQPAGGTRLGPALAEGAARLATMTGFGRHLVLVTDGRGEGGDLAAQAHALARAGITLSTIGVGEDADVALLRALAEAGGGRFVQAPDARRLAAALRRDVVLAQSPVIHEERTGVLAAPHPVLGDLAEAPIPSILGYIAVAPKPAVAVPMRTDTGDPLLAVGQFGLGRTAALMTDPQGPWGGDWRRWQGSERLLARLLHWLLRIPMAAQVTLEQVPRDDGTALIVHVVDDEGNAVNGRVLRARLHPEAGPDVHVALAQQGLGTYIGQLPGRPSRPTRVVLVDETPDARPSITTAGWLGLSYPEEYRLRGPNERLLEELRESSGGQWLGEGHLIPDRRRPTQDLALWPGLAAMGLGLFVLDLLRSAGVVRLRRPGVSRGIEGASP